MAEPIISFIAENDDQFKASIKRLETQVSDMRIPFGLIGNDWYKSNKIIFGLKSKGLYTDFGGFKPNDIIGRKTRRQIAKERKQSEVGFVYPLLKRSGALANSLTNKNDSLTEYYVGRKTLVMGTNVSYAKYHQSDKPRSILPQRKSDKPRSILPQRKVVFISGGPNEPARDSAITGRLERWLDIMNDYLSRVIGAPQ